MIEAVTFDCWGTLITDTGFERSMARRVEVVAETCRVDPPTASELLDRGWRAHHTAWLGAEQYGSPGIARFCLDELGIADDEVCARLTEAIEEAGRLGEQSALDGAVDTLRMIREAGLKTALVCDAGFTPGRIVRGFLDEHGLLEHLGFCAFSNEVGVPKPHPAIFEAALDAIGAVPERTIHVGDLLRTDIFGARELGMRSIRITQVGDDAERGFSFDPGAAFADLKGDRPAAWEHPDADEVVASHAEMPDALRRLGADI